MTAYMKYCLFSIGYMVYKQTVPLGESYEGIFFFVVYIMKQSEKEKRVTRHMRN